MRYRKKREERSIRRTHRAERSGGRLGAFLQNSDNRRLLIAFAVALLFHDIFAALVPSNAPRSAPQQVIVARVSIVHRTPAPPAPSSSPIVSRTRTLGPIAAHVVRHTTPAAQAPREIVHRPGAARPKPPAFSHVKPIWDIPVGAQGAGAGKAAATGSTGNGGAGNGAGNAGSGSGAAATQPCGYVEFSDPHGSRYDPNSGGNWVDIEMTVHFPDGHSESLTLDYPWYYRSAATNPWSDQNRDNPDFATRFQAPPAGRGADEPALVQYVVAHSTKDGLTLLRSCPGAPTH